MVRNNCIGILFLFFLDINTQLRLGLGYQFADFGKAQFGLGSAQETMQTLTISHLYAHQIRVQLTALI